MKQTADYVVVFDMVRSISGKQQAVSRIEVMSNRKRPKYRWLLGEAIAFVIDRKVTNEVLKGVPNYSPPLVNWRVEHYKTHKIAYQ